MASFRFAEGNTDDSELTELSREAMQTPLGKMIFSRGESFISSLARQYSDSRVIVCKDGNRLLGMGVCSRFRASLFGRPAVEVGYLNQLRSKEDARGLTFLVRAYRFLEGYCRKEQLPVYLTTILEGNQLARDILESGRAGLPSYKKITRLGTMLLRGNNLRKFTKMTATLGQEFSLSTSSAAPSVWDQRDFRMIVIAKPTIPARLTASVLFRSMRPLFAERIDIPIRYLTNWSSSPAEFVGCGDSGLFALTLDERDQRFSLAQKLSSHTTYSILYGVEWETSTVLSQLMMSSAPIYIDAGLL